MSTNPRAKRKNAVRANHQAHDAPKPPPLLCTISASGRYLGLSRTMTTKLVDDGVLAHKLVGADRRVPYSELLRYASSGLVGAEKD